MAEFKIYKSSAGSGKTFTLVKEYLAIALKDPAKYRNILALTFTNKAAGEMKERILSELALLASGADCPMKKVLHDEFGIDPAGMPEAAAKVQANILHDYANFAVRTIDSFTHKLIRSFAKDLELPGRFEIEMDSKMLLQRTIDALMDKIGRDDYVTEILVRFVEEKLRDQDGWRIEANLSEVGYELFKETSKAHIQHFKDFDSSQFPDFIDLLRKEKRDFADHMQHLAQTALGICQDFQLDPRDFIYGPSSVMVALQKLSEAKKPKDFQDLIEGRAFKQASLEDKWYTKGGEHPRLLQALDHGLRSVVGEMQAHFDQAFQGYATSWHAFQNVHSLAVLSQIEALIEDYKEQFNLVHISDFQPKIEQFMRNEAPEYIYWRLGERYQHFMLDEFQDTSLLQWLNLRPLVQNLKAGLDGSLLIVGDSKQAIYRWRGGDTGLMEFLVPNDLEVEPKVLNTNYRSREYVVDFNNRFFDAALKLIGESEPEIGQIYSDHAQKVRPGNENAGFVRVELLAHEQYKFGETARERTLELIQSLREQGFAYSDIAILYRNNRDGSKMAELLSEHNIRVISSESILLSKAPVVNFIIACFKFLFDPSDQIARAELLHFFFHWLHADAALNIDPNRKIREILADSRPVQAIFEQLPPAFKRMSFQTDRLSLYELAEEIVRIFELNSSTPAFVQFFLDVVLEFSERRKPDLGAFIEYWQEKKDGFSVIVPEGEDAVEIMTVHKSKGLEFPVVIIPEASWDAVPKANSTIWAESGEAFGAYPQTHLVAYQGGLENSAFADNYQKEKREALLDNLNMLYVAFTRAKERLYVLAPTIPKSSQAQAGNEELKNVGALIRNVLATKEFQGLDPNIYESGFPIPAAAKQKQPTVLDPPHLVSSPWRDRIRIDRKFRKYWEGETEGEAGLSPLLTEFFRQLPDAKNEKWVLDNMEEGGLLSPRQRQQLAATANTLLASDSLRNWFAPGNTVRQHMKFLLGQAEPLSVDRLILETGKTTLIVFVDGSREKPDKRALQSCAKFLAETEEVDVEAWIYTFPGCKAEKL